MFSNIEEIKMFEITECTKMKKRQDRDDFAFRHLHGAISAPFAVSGLELELFEFFGKFPAKIVRNTENPGNFVWGKHAHVFCYLVDIHL
jgi:hypothetical protein